MAGVDSLGSLATTGVDSLGSLSTHGNMEDPQAQKEATRVSVSLFARKSELNQHKEQLEANAHMIGGSLTVTYVSSSSSSLLLSSLELSDTTICEP